MQRQKKIRAGGKIFFKKKEKQKDPHPTSWKAVKYILHERPNSPKMSRVLTANKGLKLINFGRLLENIA